MFVNELSPLPAGVVGAGASVPGGLWGMLGSEILAASSSGDNGPGLAANDALSPGLRYLYVLESRSAPTVMLYPDTSHSGPVPYSGVIRVYEEGTGEVAASLQNRSFSVGNTVLPPAVALAGQNSAQVNEATSGALVFVSEAPVEPPPILPIGGVDDAYVLYLPPMSDPRSPLTLSRHRGDTFADAFVIKLAATGQPVNITGRTFLLTVDPEVAPVSGVNNVYQLAGQIMDGPGGRVAFVPTSQQANQVGQFFFDIQMTDTNGLKRTLVVGKYIYKQDITK
jgi:hypothetical protein